MLHQPPPIEEAAEGEPEAVPEAKGACFIAQDRVCSADCMAYLQKPPTGVDYIGEQWARCAVLVSLHRGSKHLTILADVGAKLVASKRQEEREKKAPGVG